MLGQYRTSRRKISYVSTGHRVAPYDRVVPHLTKLHTLHLSQHRTRTWQNINTFYQKSVPDVA
eukprot:3941957-Rhodomonas_salina.2